MNKYLPLYEKFLQQQSAWVSQEVRPDAIYKIAQQVGMTRADFDSCLANQSMIDADHPGLDHRRHAEPVRGHVHGR